MPDHRSKYAPYRSACKPRRIRHDPQQLLTDTGAASIIRGNERRPDALEEMIAALSREDCLDPPFLDHVPARGCGFRDECNQGRAGDAPRFEHPGDRFLRRLDRQLDELRTSVSGSEPRESPFIPHGCRCVVILANDIW